MISTESALVTTTSSASVEFAFKRMNCFAASWVPKKALLRLMSSTFWYLLFRGLQHGGPGFDPRVVDQHIQAAEVPWSQPTP